MAVQYGRASGLSVQMAGPYGAAGGGAAVKIVSIDIPAAGWKGAVSPYSQVVSVDGVSVSSKVDLLPSAQQLQEYRFAGFLLTTENDGGEVTVYAIGRKPEQNLTLEAALTEVVVV